MLDGELHEFLDPGVGDRRAVGERVDRSAGGVVDAMILRGKGRGEVGLTGLYRYLCLEG